MSDFVDQADRVLMAASNLPVEERVALLDAIDALNGLPPRERPHSDRSLSDLEERFVDTYANMPDTKRAAKQMDIPAGKAFGMLVDPPVGRAVRRKLEERADRSELTADYVRDYVFGILELCPTDYFMIDGDGDWCVDPEAFKGLPASVKRYVDSVEIKADKRNGTVRYSVKFVSKSQAMALAAKYTLTEKHAVSHAHVQVPWDEIAASVKALPAHDEADPLEKEIASAASQ